jgi:acylphosphatase
MDKEQKITKEIHKRLEACIQGRVQGVGFRYSTLREAQRLGLRGYVCNRADGSVKVVAEGREEDLARLLSWLQRGPGGAYVTGVKYQYQNYTDEFRRFSIEYDDF